MTNNSLHSYFLLALLSFLCNHLIMGNNCKHQNTVKHLETLLKNGEATLIGTAKDWGILEGDGDKFWRVRVHKTRSDLLALREFCSDWWEKYGNGELR